MFDIWHTFIATDPKFFLQTSDTTPASMLDNVLNMQNSKRRNDCMQCNTEKILYRKLNHSNNLPTYDMPGFFWSVLQFTNTVQAI